MLDYKVKIGLVPMRRNTTDRPRGASWNWHSPQEREKEITAYIEKNFADDNVEFIDTKGLGIGNLIFDNASAKQAIERMKTENVDAMWVMPDGEQRYSSGFETYTFDYEAEQGK